MQRFRLQNRVLSAILKPSNLSRALAYQTQIGWAWYPFLQYGMCRLDCFSHIKLSPRTKQSLSSYMLLSEHWHQNRMHKYYMKVILQNIFTNLYYKYFLLKSVHIGANDKFSTVLRYIFCLVIYIYISASTILRCKMIDFYSLAII